MKTHGVDFPRRGADSDKSKEIEMIDERYPAAFLDECREILKETVPNRIGKTATDAL